MCRTGIIEPQNSPVSWSVTLSVDQPSIQHSLLLCVCSCPLHADECAQVYSILCTAHVPTGNLLNTFSSSVSSIAEDVDNAEVHS